jgi:hypothetical protein
MFRFPVRERGFYLLQNAKAVKLTTHLNVMLRLRMGGAVPLVPLPHMPSRRAQGQLFVVMEVGRIA